MPRTTAPTLIIYSHPKTPGHNPQILSDVTAQLKKRNETYEVLDLYGMGYDPILHEKEHYTAGNKAISAQNKRIQQKITDATHLIFIYPLWWDSMPAILKGFFDRVFTSPFAFKFKKSGIPEQHLKGKRSAVFVTQGGPWFYYRLILKNRGLKIVTKDILGFCGIRTKPFSIYHASRRMDDAKKEKITRIVSKGIRWLYR